MQAREGRWRRGGWREHKGENVHMFIIYTYGFCFMESWKRCSFWRLKIKIKCHRKEKSFDCKALVHNIMKMHHVSCCFFFQAPRPGSAALLLIRSDGDELGDALWVNRKHCFRFPFFLRLSQTSPASLSFKSSIKSITTPNVQREGLFIWCQHKFTFLRMFTGPKSSQMIDIDKWDVCGTVILANEHINWWPAASNYYTLVN